MSCQDGSRTGYSAMRTHALPHELDIDRVDVEALDQFLRSDRSPPNSMMLSELDGFLTGVAIGPGLIRPSEWLPLIFGGEAPEFAAMPEAEAILGSLMARYNEILRDVAENSLAPIFWIDRDGKTIANDWAEGFVQAIKLRVDAWAPLFNSERNGKLLLPILLLCRDQNGRSLLGVPAAADDGLADQTTEFIPDCVAEIAAYWRRNRVRPNKVAWSPAPDGEPRRAGAKIGRNDPCPCGSGQKFKKCCGHGG
jgi:uncharacterized protein